MSAIFHYKASKQQWPGPVRQGDYSGKTGSFRTGDPPHTVKSFVAQILAKSRFQPMQRTDGRGPDEIRALNFELNVVPHAIGSLLVSMGQTRVTCGVTIEEAVPRCMKEQGVTGGWLTAEYSTIFDADAEAALRCKRSPRRSQYRDSAFDRPVVACSRRSRKTRAAHDLGRLRCFASRRPVK